MAAFISTYQSSGIATPSQELLCSRPAVDAKILLQNVLTKLMPSV